MFYETFILRIKRHINVFRYILFITYYFFYVDFITSALNIIKYDTFFKYTIQCFYYFFFNDFNCIRCSL